MPKKINLIIESWLNKNANYKNTFMKKLIILWPKIAGKNLTPYSVPHKIILEGKKSILLIYVYNGAASLEIQSAINLIKSQIIINIGHCAVDEFRIIQKII